MLDLQKGQIVYYAKIFPTLGIYEVCDLKLRTIEETYFAGVDEKDKRAYLFNNKMFGKRVFEDRMTALEIVLNAEEERKDIVLTEDSSDEYE